MGIRFRPLRLLNLVLGSLCLLPAGEALAQERAVWQIGQFDHSSNEFRSSNIDYANSKENPVYRVGRSTEAADWLRFQPGPANGLAGGRVHPFTILFDLPERPRGVFRLRIDILYETPRLSHLRIELNGRAGVFYFHPKLDYGAGDWEGTFVPQTSADTKTIELPVAWLRRGENRLVLTALDDPEAPENSLGAIALGHTGLVYDAIALSNDPSGRPSASAVDVIVEPTILYRNVESGLVEVVEVFANFATMPRHGKAEFILDGKKFLKSFSGLESFGETRLEFNVPEWTGTAKAELRVGRRGRLRSFPLELTAAKKWTLFIVPHEHLDIGFTDYPEKVAELHSESIDGVLEILRSTPNFRWTLDGYWVAEKYLAGRSAEKRSEFLAHLRDGQIVLPPQFANQHTGTASLEGLIRSLYDSHGFACQNEVPLGAAHITDVPSYSWSYASVLADAGVKYFAAASNNWRAPVLLLGRWNEKSPFYWEGPDGGRVLMWYSRAYLQLATLFGTPPRLAAVRDALPVFLQAYSRPGYGANAAIIFGSQLENTALSKEQAELPAEWSQLYAWPRLQFSNFQDAMQTIEAQFNRNISTFRGDFGPYWEDGFGSDSLHTAIHRQNQQRILTAEKLGSIPPLLNPDLRPERDLLLRAWRNSLLFDEHTWTFVGATTQPEAEETQTQLGLKRSYAEAAQREINESIHRSWAQLESFLGPKETSIIVFNSLSSKRSGLVSIDLQDGFGLFDIGSGNQVPVETVWIGKGTSLPGFGGGYRRVRFYAQDVPATGYRLYALRPAQAAADHLQELHGLSFESPYYRIIIDPESGALRNIWDKELNRELVDATSAFRFGALVYVSGADDMPKNSLYRFGATLKPPQLRATAASQGRLVEVRQSPFGTTVVLESSAPHTPLIRTEITLLNLQKRIELTYTLRKDYTLAKEAVYIAFPFATANPTFSYESQNAWVDPSRDELTGGSREWYAVNHWAAVSGNDATAAILPLDAPLVAFGDIVRGEWPAEFHPRSATIFSWLMNNYWGTNFSPGQGGDFTFRFALVSSRQFDPASLTRSGWEALTPLEADQVKASLEPGRLPVDEASLLESRNSDVVVVTLKPAEDGNGMIVRLEEIAGKQSTTGLSSSFFRIDQAWRCSILEDNQVELAPVNGALSITLHPFEISTLRFRTTPLSAAGARRVPGVSFREKK